MHCLIILFIENVTINQKPVMMLSHLLWHCSWSPVPTFLPQPFDKTQDKVVWAEKG